MFRETFLGDFHWEISPRILLRFVDEQFLDINDGQARTSIDLDSNTYTLNGDFRKELEETEGDLEKIKQVFLDNFERIDMLIPNADFKPAMTVFIDHINQYIK